MLLGMFWVWELEVSEALADPDGGYADSWRGRSLASLRLLAWSSFTALVAGRGEGRAEWVAGSAFGRVSSFF